MTGNYPLLLHSLDELPTYSFDLFISLFLNSLLILPGSIGSLLKILLSFELLCLSLKIKECLFEKSLLLLGLKFIFFFFFEGGSLPFDLLLLFFAIGTLVLRDFILFLESMLAKRGDIECVWRVRGTAVHYLLGKKATNDTEDISIMRTYTVIKVFKTFWAPATGTWELDCFTYRAFFLINIL